MKSPQIQISEERNMQGLWIPVGVYTLPLSWAKKILCLDIKSMKSYYKSNTMIGHFLGCSDRQARRLVAELIEEGWINAKYVNKGTKDEIRYLGTSLKFNESYHEEPEPTAENGHHPRPEMAAPPAENGHPVLPVSLNNKFKQRTASPPLSLESESDTKTNVATVKAKFLELAGKGGRWGAKQTKIAQSLLKDFPPDHVCENMKLLKEECIAKRGQYGWAFSMEKLTWKWEDIETIKEAEDADLMSEMKRLFPGWVPKSERTA